MCEHFLSTPLTAKQIRKLSVGDLVFLSGTIFTARDLAHKYLVKNKHSALAKKLRNSVIYHCGPIAKKVKNKWLIVSAGPTTSGRLEEFEPDLIKQLDIRLIIGKGGMGEKTLSALKKFGCVYCSAVGGAAASIAKCIEGVKSVHKLKEFGIPEAIWEFQVKDFPLLVSMDSKGKSLHSVVLKKSEKELKKLLR